MAPLVKELIGAIRATASRRWKRAKRLRAETRALLARHRERRRSRGRSVRHALQRRRSASLAALRAAMHPVIRGPAVWDVTPPGRAPRDDHGLQGDVLEVIEEHPEGVAAVDVGNQLGVDWRRVLGIGRELADGGLVDQIDHEFFPVEKASRRK